VIIGGNGNTVKMKMCRPQGIKNLWNGELILENILHSNLAAVFLSFLDPVPIHTVILFVTVFSQFVSPA